MSGTSDPRWPTVSADALPWLTTEQMRQADALAMGPFCIDLLQMMEHAGSSLAELLHAKAPEGVVTVLAGGGNNGGGGLCCARHLANRGRDVEIVLATERRSESVGHHLVTLAQMGIAPVAEPGNNPVVVDALVGYGLHGQLGARAAQLAQWARGRIAFSLDVPSGLGFEGAIEPVATLTLALPKETLRETRPLFLADLGLPDALWAELGLDVGPMFAEGGIVEVE